MMQMVRVVLVGCGGMSHRWMEVSKEHPQLELVGFDFLPHVRSHTLTWDLMVLGLTL